MIQVIRVFSAMKTAVWLLSGLILVLFAGSIIMPAKPDAYASINDSLLFSWLREAGASPVHWWFFAALALLAVLSLNTVVCSIDSIIKRMNRRDFLLRISPQLMHVGFLLILLAHLLSSGWGFKTSGALPEGGGGRLPGNRVVFVRSMDMVTYPSGMPRSWSLGLAEARWG